MVCLGCHPGDSWVAPISRLEAMGINTRLARSPDSGAIVLAHLS